MTDEDPIAKLEKALPEVHYAPGSIVCAPNVRAELIAKGARPELFHPGEVVVDEDGEPSPLTPVHDFGIDLSPLREAAASIRALDEMHSRALAISPHMVSASSAAAMQVQSELTMEYLIAAEKKLREAHVTPFLEPGYYLALVHPESPMGRWVMQLRQEVRRLVRREGYVGGRKARRATRRLERLAKRYPVIVQAERLRLDLGVPIELSLNIDWDETRVSDDDDGDS